MSRKVLRVRRYATLCYTYHVAIEDYGKTVLSHEELAKIKVETGPIARVKDKEGVELVKVTEEHWTAVGGEVEEDG